MACSVRICACVHLLQVGVDISHSQCIFGSSQPGSREAKTANGDYDNGVGGGGCEFFTLLCMICALDAYDNGDVCVLWWWCKHVW